MACDGDATEICGAGGRLSVWSKGGIAPVYPAVVHNVDDYMYTGCYTDSQASRALTGDFMRSTAMTIEACKAFCAPTYTIFGTEFSEEVRHTPSPFVLPHQLGIARGLC